MGLRTALQIAIDNPALPTLAELLSAAARLDAVQRIEAGTPLLTTFGVSIVERFSLYFPVQRLYVDTKCLDFAHEQLSPYLDHGIRHLSVHAFIGNDQAAAALTTAANYDATCYVSTLGYPIELLTARVAELHRMGFTAFVFHGEGILATDALRHALLRYDMGRAVPGLVRILAGGISTSTLHKLPLHDLDGIIVGRYVTNSADPVETMSLLAERLRRD